MNDMRERLIELLKKAKAAMKKENLSCDIARNMFVAEYLIANGVIVPPCKVGDTVYEIEYDLNSGWWEAHPLETEVKAVCILTENDYYPLNRVGKDVFLTREEAERALKERE